MEKKNQQKLWTAMFIAVVCINALNGLALYIANPVMTTYLKGRGVAFQYTGLISSLLSWIAMAFRPFSGAASDRINKKYLLMFSMIVTGLCLFSYALTSNVAVIIAIRVVHGIAFAISGTISMSFATEFIPVERIAEGISYLGVANLLSSMLGPQVGAIIMKEIGINYVFYISSAFCFVCFIALMMIKYTPKVKKDKKQEKLKLENFFAKELLLYLFLISILTLGNGMISYYLVDFGESRNIENISLFFTVYSVTLLLMKPFVGKLQDLKGVKVILYPAFAVYAVGIFILSRSYTLLPVLIAAVLKGMGQGNGTPAIQAESIKKLGIERNGVAISTCLIGQDIGNAVGPIFASSVGGMVGYERLFQIYSVMLIVALLIYFFNNKKKGEVI